MVEKRIQRKLTAILSADVVGYSSLMGRDEAGTLAALKEHRAALFDPVIAEHDGRTDRGENGERPGTGRQHRPSRSELKRHHLVFSLTGRKVR